MARLIDADSLLEKIHDTAEGLADCDQQNAAWALLKYAVRDIMDEETVDAVEVVRCKDCKHWKPSGSKGGKSVSDMEYIGGCKFTNCCRRESDFCSYGERRTDG